MLSTELVEVAYSAEQNAQLAESFKDFYKLDSGPKVKKALVVDKAKYVAFVKSRTRLRTQFEARADAEIDLSFDSIRIPFEFVATKTDFLLPSGAKVSLYEELDAPCGLTKLVTATYGAEKLEFQSYFQAEGYALAKFLEEVR